MRSSPEQVAALMKAIARGEPPPSPRAPRARKPKVITSPLPSPRPSPKKKTAKRRYIPKAHPGSPVDVVDLELERLDQRTDMEIRVDGLISEAAPFEEVTVGPISAFGTSEAAEVLASSSRPPLAPRPSIDQVISSTAAAIEQKRIEREKLTAELERQRSRGNWKKQCTARDAENGLRCGQLEGHLVATASRKATPHTTARGEFVRCLEQGAEASRSRELAEWANDRRDVGDVSP